MTVKSELVKLTEAADCLRALTPLRPKIALILGSGLGNFAGQLENSTVIDAAQIPHFPRSTVEGHAGRVHIGFVRSNGTISPPILLFQGRTHFYESGSLLPITFPVKLASRLGATHLIVTNAAGGINRSFQPGDLMLISDVLSFTFLADSRKTGSEIQPDPVWSDRYGSGTPHSIPFDTSVNDLFRTTAKDLGMRLAEGVYCWLKGPSYETAAEIAMLARCGVDAVGMSTVPEISEAYRCGMSVAGISLISNMATGLTNQKLSHSEVTATAQTVETTFMRLMNDVLVRMASVLTQDKPGTT